MDNKKRRPLPRAWRLILASLLPFLPGYALTVLVWVTPVTVFAVVNMATAVLWGALSWRLMRPGEDAAGHVGLLSAVPLIMLLFVLLDPEGLIGGVGRVYYGALLLPGYLVSSIFTDSEAASFIAAFAVMVLASTAGALLKLMKLKRVN